MTLGKFPGYKHDSIERQNPCRFDVCYPLRRARLQETGEMWK